MDAFEAKVQQGVTLAFIDADSFSCILTRSDLIRTPSGGTAKANPAPVYPQTARLIPQTDTTMTVNTVDGDIVVPAYVLLMSWDADVMPGDTFPAGEETLEVATVKRNDYEKKCQVVSRG